MSLLTRHCFADRLHPFESQRRQMVRAGYMRAWKHIALVAVGLAFFVFYFFVGGA